MFNHRLPLIIGLCILLSGCVVSTGGKTIMGIVACVIAVVAALVGEFRCKRETRIVKKCKLLDKSIEDIEQERAKVARWRNG